MTEILVRKVIGGINGFKNGTKTKDEVETLLVLLEKTNEGMYADYNKKYLAAIAEVEKRK